MPRNGTIKNERILKPNIVKGYNQITLQKNGQKKYYKIHRLVAETFINNPKNLPEVNHIDGNKQNNTVDNLEWVTTSENQLHSCYKLHNKIRKVFQYTLDNKLIQIWDSAKIASKELKIPCQNISACCRNELQTAGKYKWSYIERGELYGI